MSSDYALHGRIMDAFAAPWGSLLNACRSYDSGSLMEPDDPNRDFRESGKPIHKAAVVMVDGKVYHVIVDGKNVYPSIYARHPGESWFQVGTLSL